MNDFLLSYREVIPDQNLFDSWKEISLNTGGTQGTLQDIKVAERANGFCYKDTSRHHTRNRFIYWRISYDVLELVEHSLDVNLSGNRLRYKFIDTPILDGISIHETQENIVILVPTVCSVHRLVFPHPDKYHRPDDALSSHPDMAAPSIFAEASVADAMDPTTFHCFTNINNAQLPHLADSILTLDEEEAIFCLAYPSGDVSLVKQWKNGKVETIPLKCESLVPKFISGIAEKLRPKDKEFDVTVSLLLYRSDVETYALTLYRNGHLKFWSCSKGECISVVDVLLETGNTVKNQLLQNNILRKTVDDEKDNLIAIFMCFLDESQIQIFKPIINKKKIKLHRKTTLHSLQTDLIDFSLSTSRIWSVWRSKDGNCEVYTSTLKSENFWIPVILQSLPDSEQPPNFDGESDPGHAYLQYIFHPGQFPLHIISKALNIYKRTNIISEMNLSATILKQQIRKVVEEEIEKELKELIVNDEDYLECASYCWQRFYSCCVQYHVAALKPLGLLLLPYVSGAVLLKKSTFSILRPLDSLEHLFLCGDYSFPDQFNSFCLEIDIIEDIIKLFEVIIYLEEQINQMFSYTFEKELFALNSPDIIMEQLLVKLQSEMDNELTDQIANMLSQCNNLYQAIHKILELLRVENQICPEVFDQIDSSISHIFTSHLGVSLISNSLRQQILIKFSICRNLLLISNILLKRNEINWNILEAIRSVCTPEIIILIQANFVMNWLSNLPSLTFLSTETSFQRLSSLNLNPVFNLRINFSNPIGLLELFAGSSGGYEARKTFTNIGHNEENIAHWHKSLLLYLNCLYHVTWPICNSPIFAEWLLSSGQHLWLQQYYRLISKWCEYNNCTHSFLVATSLLTTGENYKAEELFKVAAKGIFTDKFLIEKLVIDQLDETAAYINYYLKIIDLFELHKGFDCAINLANTALSVSNINDPLRPILYSIKFKHYLTLKNYKMAFESLIGNPDVERKKDNLRDLVKTLLDDKKLNILIEFNYVTMETLFCKILFARARATEPFNNICYDFLYAYQMKRGLSCIRLAASIMYEQAFRLNYINDINALEKQVKCYLAAQNALCLCEPDFAWIIMPNDKIEDIELKLEFFKIDTLIRKKIKIITLDTLKKELNFACAKLKLFKLHSNSFMEIHDTKELVTLLSTSGLFKTAMNLCEVFDLDYQIPFEVLTKICSNLTKDPNENTWKWLLENNLQEISSNSKNDTEAVWNLLKEFIDSYEKDNLTVIHQIVCNELIKMHMFIPQWLMDSYKKRNPSELLRLFFKNGRLDEAIQIAGEFMMAALGHGKEYYGFETTLQLTSKPFCLPINSIINLIYQLKFINDTDSNQPYLKEYEYLNEVFKTYTDTALRVTNEMCQYKDSLIKEK